MKILKEENKKGSLETAKKMQVIDFGKLNEELK